MQRVFAYILSLLLSFGLYAQQYDYSIGQQIEKIDSIVDYLVQYQDLGFKTSGSEELNDARDWIIDKYESFGYDNIRLDSFVYSNKQLQNIIIEKPGIDTNSWIIIGAHYDTYPNSKGANDNGSGIVACMQIARIMLNIETETGVRIIHFSAEENGLVGSTHYVAHELDKNDKIEMVLNLDQLGGTKDGNNSKIYCERDEHNTPKKNNDASAAVTDTLAMLVQSYSGLQPLISRAYASDYMPFQDSGYVITGLYQESHYPFYHQSGDLVANMDVAATKQVIQCAIAAAMFFARNTLPVGIEQFESQEVKLYPNPATNGINIDPSAYTMIELTNSVGQVVLREKPSSNWLDLSALHPGLYTVRLSDERTGVIKHSRLIIAH